MELIVSLTITGLIISAGYTGLAAMLDLEARSRQTFDETLEAASRRRATRRWVQGASVGLDHGSPGFVGLDGTLETLPDDRLSFLSSAGTPLRSEQVAVQLWVDRDARTPQSGLVAQFASWPGPETVTVEVDTRVSALNIRYFSPAMGDDGWLPSWVSRTILPSAIEITLGGDSVPELLRLPMLVPVGTAP